MDFTIPAVLKALSVTGSAIKELATWRKDTTGNIRSLLLELEGNLCYLDIVSGCVEPRTFAAE